MDEIRCINGITDLSIILVIKYGTAITKVSVNTPTDPLYTFPLFF